MLMVEHVFGKQDFPYEVWIKPHPHNHIELSKYSKLEAKYMDLPLSELLPMTHVAISSVFTSAALDIFCAGIPVINYLDPYYLNYSSMRGFDGTNYVSSAEEFLQALEEVKSRECKTVNPEDFFLLDAELPKWKALLEGKLIPHSQNDPDKKNKVESESFSC